MNASLGQYPWLANIGYSGQRENEKNVFKKIKNYNTSKYTKVGRYFGKLDKYVLGTYLVNTCRQK